MAVMIARNFVAEEDNTDYVNMLKGYSLGNITISNSD